MKLNDEMQNRLMALAGKNPPSDRVPYAFEKRIMSRIAALAPQSPWALWGGPLWRAALSCMAITVLCGIWAYSAPRQPDAQESFSQAFEATVFAPPAQHVEDAW